MGAAKSPLTTYAGGNTHAPAFAGAPHNENPNLRSAEIPSMKTSHSLVSTVVFAGLLSVSAFATTPAAHRQATAALKFEKPAPATVVSPTELPPSFEGRTVDVSLTIDAAGQPHDVKVVSTNNKSLRKSLVAAISQWSFKPARKNGVPVSTKVLLPVELVRS